MEDLIPAHQLAQIAATVAATMASTMAFTPASPTVTSSRRPYRHDQRSIGILSLDDTHKAHLKDAIHTANRMDSNAYALTCTKLRQFFDRIGSIGKRWRIPIGQNNALDVPEAMFVVEVLRHVFRAEPARSTVSRESNAQRPAEIMITLDKLYIPIGKSLFETEYIAAREACLNPRMQLSTDPDRTGLEEEVSPWINRISEHYLTMVRLENDGSIGPQNQQRARRPTECETVRRMCEPTGDLVRPFPFPTWFPWSLRQEIANLITYDNCTLDQLHDVWIQWSAQNPMDKAEVPESAANTDGTIRAVSDGNNRTDRRGNDRRNDRRSGEQSSSTDTIHHDHKKWEKKSKYELDRGDGKPACCKHELQQWPCCVFPSTHKYKFQCRAHHGGRCKNREEKWEPRKQTAAATNTDTASAATSAGPKRKKAPTSVRHVNANGETVTYTSCPTYDFAGSCAQGTSCPLAQFHPQTSKRLRQTRESPPTDQDDTAIAPDSTIVQALATALLSQIRQRDPNDLSAAIRLAVAQPKH